MRSKTLRDARIDLRVSEDFKHRVAEASALYGVSVSTFISMSAMERAEQVLADRKSAVLTDTMREQFMAALSRPARPIPESVRRAQQGYRQAVSNRSE